MTSEYKFVGSRYDASLDVAEIAKRLRSEIKDLINKSMLPKGKYSVKIERYSGGRSINIRVTEFEFKIVDHTKYEVVDGEYQWPRYGGNYTKIAEMTLHTLNSILHSYNMDNSDIQTDYFHVKFYGHAAFDWQVVDKETKDIEDAARASIVRST